MNFTEYKAVLVVDKRQEIGKRTVKKVVAAYNGTDPVYEVETHKATFDAKLQVLWIEELCILVGMESIYENVFGETKYNNFVVPMKRKYGHSDMEFDVMETAVELWNEFVGNAMMNLPPDDARTDAEVLATDEVSSEDAPF